MAWPPPGAWTSVPSPGGNANAMWLMLDGTVLAHLSGGTQLVKLVPDQKGNYSSGSWQPAGNFLLQKEYYGSVVLSNGKLVTFGGEYSGPGFPQSETNFCEIYEPPAGTSTLPGTSTQLPPPPGWTNIGDSPTCVLNDGTVILGNTQGVGNQLGILNPSTLAWTIGVGDSTNEEGYVLLQTGDVLTCSPYQQISKRYVPASQAFVLDATVPVMLGDGSEIGPGITMMDGRVIWFGASGHTCIYTPSPGQSGTWTQGPDFPTIANGDQLIASDVAAILQPNGKVLVMTQGIQTAAVFVEYDPATNTFAVLGPAPAGNYQFSVGGAGDARFLMLPNGHILFSFTSGGWYDLTCEPVGQAAWAPTITSFPSSVKVGTTVTLHGTQLCGLSECYGYGDDNQQSENYPVVRFVDGAGNTAYARTHDVSTRGISPGLTGSVSVDVPATLTPGNYTIYVSAIGIISSGQAVTVS